MNAGLKDIRLKILTPSNVVRGIVNGDSSLTLSLGDFVYISGSTLGSSSLSISLVKSLIISGEVSGYSEVSGDIDRSPSELKDIARFDSNILTQVGNQSLINMLSKGDSFLSTTIKIKSKIDDI